MVVATMQTRHATVYIHDDAYAGKTEAELEKIRQEARRVAWRILRSAHEREQKMKGANESEGTVF